MNSFKLATLAVLMTPLLSAVPASAITVNGTTVTAPANLGTFASGATFALGDTGVAINANLSNSSTTATKTFFDEFVFTVTTPISFIEVGSPTTVNTGTISNFIQTLYAVTTAPTVFSTTGTSGVVGTSLGSSAISTPLSFASLAAGTYVLEISGTLSRASVLLGVTVPSVASFVIPNVTAAAPTSAVPEPATWLIMATGLAGLALFRRRAARI